MSFPTGRSLESPVSQMRLYEKFSTCLHEHLSEQETKILFDRINHLEQENTLSLFKFGTQE